MVAPQLIGSVFPPPRRAHRLRFTAHPNRGEWRRLHDVLLLRFVPRRAWQPPSRLRVLSTRGEGRRVRASPRVDNTQKDVTTVAKQSKVAIAGVATQPKNDTISPYRGSYDYCGYLRACLSRGHCRQGQAAWVKRRQRRIASFEVVWNGIYIYMCVCVLLLLML